ncbi:MICOS complex subunit MIC26 [Microcaecilia unicolor]|uniref:MICOS complex subunit n=1 Tax=Microcaecilia unicolor TaxID=1415580 RepID=A0A6P7XRT5_9AMPH|nr:MICOS complex subunit MIC26 [Microcaecilia unicolor]
MFLHRAVMLKVMRLTVLPASLGLVSLRMYATSEEDVSKKVLLKVEELSLYTNPVPDVKYVEKQQTQLEERVSWLRHAVGPYTAWCQDAYTKAKPRVTTAVEHCKGSYEYLRDAPPGFYPRLGLIGFAGIIGLFLARGSKLKRVIYPLGFMGLGASMYYPEQAVTVVKGTSSTLYDWGLQGYVAVESLWKDGMKKKKSIKKTSETPEVTPGEGLPQEEKPPSSKAQ